MAWQCCDHVKWAAAADGFLMAAAGIRAIRATLRERGEAEADADLTLALHHVRECATEADWMASNAALRELVIAASAPAA